MENTDYRELLPVKEESVLKFLGLCLLGESALAGAFLFISLILAPSESVDVYVIFSISSFVVGIAMLLMGEKYDL